MVSNLMGKSNDPFKLIGTAYDEKTIIPVHEKRNDDTALYTVYFYLLILNYLFENYQAALDYSELLKPYAKSQIANPGLPAVNLYDSLARLALYPNEKKSKQKISHERGQKKPKNHKKMDAPFTK